jgi:hypothetical protein
MEIEGMEITNEPLNNVGKLWEDYKNRAKPVPAGYHTAVLSSINEFNTYTTQKGDPFPVANLDFELYGGELDGKSLRFQRLIINQLIGLFQAAGVEDPPGTTVELAEGLAAIKDTGAVFKVRTDLEAFSTEAYTAKLMELTETDDGDTARSAAGKDEKREAAQYATIFTSAREFPVDSAGEPLTTVDCPYTQGKVQARAVVKGFATA